MKNKILLIEDDIKPDIKVLDKEVKHSISAIFKRDVQKDKTIIWVVKIQPQTISDQENEVKNPTTKDLYDLIEKQIIKSDNLEIKFDNHIVEFNSFKSDMLEFKSDINKKLDDHIIEFKSFKSDMLSLPTISKEFNKK